MESALALFALLTPNSNLDLRLLSNPIKEATQMNKQPLQTRVAKLLALAFGLSCIIAFCQTRANADTLTITGTSDTQDPLLSSLTGQVGFLGQAFNNNFIVTANGQTFDFVFGQFTVGQAIGDGDSGCTDGPCLPITLTGNLTSPVGPLSFGGFFEEAEGGGSRFLSVDWLTGSGPFAFTTVEGGSGTFTLELLDPALMINSTASAQLFDQTARITITSFTPGAAAAVPEPTTMIMLGSGLAGLIISKRRRRRGDV